MAENEEISREFENIYARNVDSVYRLCYTFTLSHDLSWGYTREAFLKLLKSGKHFSQDKDEKAYLLQAAAQICIHGGKKGEDNPGNPILTALTDLPDSRKLLAYLYYYEGFSTMEIAQYLRSTPAKIRGELSQIRSELKQEPGDDAL